MHVDVKEQFGMETAECVELWLVVGVDAVSVESIRLFCIRVEQNTDSELGRPMTTQTPWLCCMGIGRKVDRAKIVIL